MKKKIRITQFNGDILELNYNTRNIGHLRAQQTYKATVVQDKRFKKDKYKNTYLKEYN